jgi:hypothetical protein
MDRIVDSKEARGCRMRRRDLDLTVTAPRQVFEVKQSSPISSTDPGMRSGRLGATDLFREPCNCGRFLTLVGLQAGRPENLRISVWEKEKATFSQLPAASL